MTGPNVARDPLVSRLAALDTPTLSDALDRAGVAGVVLGLHALSVPRRIAGRAVTVQLGPADGKPHDRHLCSSAVEAAGPGQVIVIANRGRTDAAGWGGLLSLSASMRGVEGVVIDGAARDVDESRELGLPVYGRTGVPISARGRVVEQDWDVRVPLGEMWVGPGDLVLADGSGVVIVSAADAENVLAHAEEIAARERVMAEAIRAGRPVGSVMGAKYETMTEKSDS